MKRVIYISVGCLSLVIGFIGALIPFLPSFPFLLLATYCFGRSSKKLNDWFVATKLYKNNLETYVEGRGMTKKSKYKIMATVSTLMIFGFIMMKKVPLGQFILFIVWLGHIGYFIFGVKTIENKNNY